jgi:dTDP-glucose 4,6-dehydratase
MTLQRLFVTGSAGFIGSGFVRHLLATQPNTQVLSFDALTYAGHRENLEDLPDPERHTFVEGDITDAQAVTRAMEDFEPDALVNIAAETHVDRSILDPLPFARTNVLGTQVLLSAAREAGIRMLQVSTDEVYGSLVPPEQATVDHPLRPSNPYAASKVAGDLLVQAAYRTHGQDVLITRCTNNFGPRQSPEKLIPLMILKARAGQPLPVYGDGLQIRDWLHVRDHAAGLGAVLARGVAGDIYHLSGDGGRTNLEVVRTLIGLVGGSESQIQHVRDRPGHDRRYALDDSTTRSMLDWSPTVGFEEGLRETVAWYLEHADWCRRVAGADLRAFLDANYEGRGP